MVAGAALSLKRLMSWLLIAAGAGCATVGGESASDAQQAEALGFGADVAQDTLAPGATVKAFGVQLKGLRLSANGYVVDLRYRVLDVEKARPLLDRKVRPVLVDEATGDRFYVPVPPIVGALRQTSRNRAIRTDRDYFMLFANPDRKLQAGSRVTLYVGKERFGNLLVEPQAPRAEPAERPAAN